MKKGSFTWTNICNELLDLHTIRNCTDIYKGKDYRKITKKATKLLLMFQLDALALARVGNSLVAFLDDFLRVFAFIGVAFN